MDFAESLSFEKQISNYIVWLPLAWCSSVPLHLFSPKWGRLLEIHLQSSTLASAYICSVNFPLQHSDDDFTLTCSGVWEKIICQLTWGPQLAPSICWAFSAITIHTPWIHTVSFARSAPQSDKPVVSASQFFFFSSASFVLDLHLLTRALPPFMLNAKCQFIPKRAAQRSGFHLFPSAWL